MRAGRSVKQTVTGFTPPKTSFPLLKVTFFAFCTKSTSTFFDCLPPAVQIISAFLLLVSAGDCAWVVDRFAILRPVRAPHIRISLFIFIGFVSSAFGFGLTDLSFIGASIGL